MNRDRERDRGSATVWVAMAVTVFCTVFAVVLAMGQAVVARHRAGSAADLAVLAAADNALRGTATACAKAAEVARAQGAAVVRCAVRGEIAEVTAQARFGPYAPTVRSRAGPPGLPVRHGQLVDGAPGHPGPPRPPRLPGPP
ncbi:Rv3654c family TadE-like protein [Streptomyces sp. NPDC019890]|uniref:Rv3654c family TadE-like protein n=1 Tax=Streptomyces sp. NPDC019890 TaxID=3365064 RepID=UPI00385146C0